MTRRSASASVRSLKSATVSPSLVEDHLIAGGQHDHPQHVVPAQQRLPGPAEPLDVQARVLVLEVAVAADVAVVQGAASADPQRLLALVERERLVPAGRVVDQRRVPGRLRPLPAQPFHHPGHRRHARRGEQVGQFQLVFVGAQGVDHPHGPHRVTAELEEVVENADLVHLERVLPDTGDHPLQLVARRHVRGVQLRPGVLRGRQRVAVDLAVGRGWQVAEDVGGRPHVPGELGPQHPAQILRAARRRRVRFDVGHQPHPAAEVLPSQHGRLSDAGLLGEQALDLAEVDPVAVDLHLVVQPPDDLDRAVRPVPRGVAGAVQDPVRVVGERVGDELRVGGLRPVEVVGRDVGAGDVQLAEHPRRHRLQCVVEHVGAHVRDRPADRRQERRPLVGVQGRAEDGEVGGGHDGDLGRAIDVDHVERQVGRRPGAHPLAGDAHVAQHGVGRPRHRPQPLGHRGQQQRVGDPAFDEPVPQPGRRRGDLGVADVHLATGGQHRERVHLDQTEAR